MSRQVCGFMFQVSTKANVYQLLALGLALGGVLMGMPTGGGGGGVG